jgi:hypothetical protein
MTAFKKFDAHAFLKREQRRVFVGASATHETESPQVLAALATLAAPSVETEIRTIGFRPVIHGGSNQIETAIPAKIAKVAKVQPAVSGHHPYRLIFDTLERRCPDFVPNGRWKRAIEDAKSFLATWEAQAQAFGWTTRELFGLPDVPDRPRPSYQRLSRYDQTGLAWLLRGRRVVELTKDKAVIETATGTVSYRRYNKPALGPLGDSLNDFAPAVAANKSDATTVKHNGLPRPDDLSAPEFLRESNV